MVVVVDDDVADASGAGGAILGELWEGGWGGAIWSGWIVGSNASAILLSWYRVGCHLNEILSSRSIVGRGRLLQCKKRYCPV